MPNERITENIVRDLLRSKGYYDDSNIVVEEQQSDIPRINKLLESASKRGRGKGFPEFLISFKDKPDDIIVIECKANVSFHESEDRNKPKDYAVDGVLLYADYLKDSYNVTAVAVSGENEREKKISSFVWLKKHFTYKSIQDKLFFSPQQINELILEQSKPFTEDELIQKAIDYNSKLHSYSIPEVERCTLISAVLIALQDKPFLIGYREYKKNIDLIDGLIDACRRVLKSNELDNAKTKVIIDEYSKFKNNVLFSSQTFYNKKKKKSEKNKILRDFIIDINDEILPYINKSEFDVLGKFYTQFIRYAGNDKKTGLVLTPTHITDLFCELADLNVNDVVFDECCGTAGFLVSAMNYMLKKAGKDKGKELSIKSSQLVGIEARSDMFSHACSNMMMRGDGKSHIIYGDCFKEENKRAVKELKPTKAFLNPPYQDGNASEQLEFIENALDCLVKDGICIAICQMSTTVSNNPDVIEVRKRLLENHTLEATFSMPVDLFHPVGVNTSILIFKAKTPHPNKKTFFGYYKDDGFSKTKKHGRIDKYNEWDSIKSLWVKAYINRESIPGISVTQSVNAQDEWCAEAYMETDYTKVEKKDFIDSLHLITIHLFSNGKLSEATSKSVINNKKKLNKSKWEWFNLVDYFEMYAGKYYPKDSYNSGSTPLISSSDTNNGVMTYTDINGKFANCITIGKVGMSTYYQPTKFVASSDVTILKPKFEMNQFSAIFIVTLLKMDKYKWSYGRQIRLNDSQKLKLKLPTLKKGVPDWDYMENYIKSLPYSKNLVTL